MKKLVILFHNFRIDLIEFLRAPHVSSKAKALAIVNITRSVCDMQSNEWKALFGNGSHCNTKILFEQTNSEMVFIVFLKTIFGQLF